MKAPAKKSCAEVPLEGRLFVAILKCADGLSQDAEQLIKSHGLTGAQYNVLRILRGAGKDGASCKDIGSRMVARDPDITRLMDRLEQRGLLTRDRAREDRRIVTHRLSEAGLELVNALDGPIEAVHRRTLGRMKAQKLRDLVGLLEEIRAGIQNV